MQIAQRRGVWRRDVDGDVIGCTAHRSKALYVVIDSPVDGSIGVLADVDADYSAIAKAIETSRDDRGAMVRKSQSIDQCTGLGQSKQTRSGLPRLRAGCDGTDFNEAEPELAESVHSLCVLVKTCRQTDPVRKAQAHESDRGAAQRARGKTPVKPRGFQRELVSSLRIECEESRAKRRIAHGRRA